ncbi:hypothetical protein F0562_032539 [Nyssa sinensis]|uniref:Uncharacterized protein n=1 Tax=Nyssa sinensis TaxID=561372 RepID=A0A5J5ANF0_9ASTE|nr:hypothetical protein F0562_032539 [Nyssa sinensis]
MMTNSGDNGAPSSVMRTRTRRIWVAVYDVRLMEKMGGLRCGVSDCGGCLGAVVAGYNCDNSTAMAMGNDETLGHDETLCNGGEYWYEASLMMIGIASLDFGGWSDRWVWRQKYREGVIERLKGGVDIWTGLLSNGAERFGTGMNLEGGYIGV